MTYSVKKTIVSSDKISVIHLGPETKPVIYLFGDVLDELTFVAGQKEAFGLIVGQFYKKVDKTPAAIGSTSETLDKPEDKKTSLSALLDNAPPGMLTLADVEIPDFVEITAFKTIYPVNDSLEFAARLRNLRDFRNTQEAVPMGMVRLSKVSSELWFEDLMVQRTYFATPGQIFLLISADRKPPRAYMMDKMHDHFVECGLELVFPKNAELPFDQI